MGDMRKRLSGLALGSLGLWAVSAVWAGSESPAHASPGKELSAPARAAKPEPAVASDSRTAASDRQGNLQAATAPARESAPEAPKPILADAFIAQSVLRVYLNRPASISVYNSRGQQVFHLDSGLPVEAVPLQGVSTGFVYLTVRTAQGEMTKKLVFTGK